MATRGGAQKAQEARQSRPGSEGMVRAAKIIPTLAPQSPVQAKETEPQDNGLPCSGRCGHCDYHPCRLHAPV